jgi:6-pyruvoyltetrahydropterin/6-carboxytetrahydropterin synthase
MITATRYHDISAGHRVYGHESKCKHLHGHNYRIHFTVEAKELDEIGRVLDFGVIKEKLCMWVEKNWDHRTLLWHEDPFSTALAELDPEGILIVSFNPTAENMAEYLIKVVGPSQLPQHVVLTEVVIEETMKCRVSYKL